MMEKQTFTNKQNDGSEGSAGAISNSFHTAQEQDIEIDLRELLWAVAAQWKAVLLAALVGALIFGCYHHFLLKPVYEASASIFITSNDSVISISELQLSSELTEDYSNILKSYTVLTSVIEELELDMDYRRLSDLVTISNPTDSHIIVITVTCSDENLCRSIANSMMNIGVDRIYQVIGNSEPTIIDYAVADSVEETTPSLFRYVLIGTMLGIAVVCILVVIWFLLDTTMKSEADIQQYLHIPVLCTVPRYVEEKKGKQEGSAPAQPTEASPKRTKKRRTESEDEGEINQLFQDLLTETGTTPEKYRPRMLEMKNENLPYAFEEAMNVLRGNIQLSGYKLKTIAITSSLPNEGKSTISFQLAKSMAGLEKRILYIDSDIRNTDFYRRYQANENGAGLTEYLCGQVSKEQIVLHTEDKYLDVILTGAKAPNPSELISGALYTELLSFVRSVYDYVIVDTPPLNLVVDGLLIAKQCDGTVLVIESEKTDRAEAEKAQQQMTYAKLKVLGAVLNKVEVRRHGYGYGHKYGYGYGYYGYGYGYGYGNHKNEKTKKKSSKKKSL